MGGLLLAFPFILLHIWKSFPLYIIPLDHYVCDKASRSSPKIQTIHDHMKRVMNLDKLQPEKMFLNLEIFFVTMGYILYLVFIDSERMFRPYLLLTPFESPSHPCTVA
jgi:hypothetical protein